MDAPQGREPNQDKQAVLYLWAEENGGTITRKQANALLKHHYYWDHQKYVARLLSQMVEARLFLHAGGGLYQINQAWRGPRPQRAQQATMPTLF